MAKKREHSYHKHVPMRTCVVCREKFDKRSLTRLVWTDSGLQVDPGGKMKGRGAYLCDRRSCWERVVNTNILDNALRATLTDEDRKRLQETVP